MRASFLLAAHRLTDVPESVQPGAAPDPAGGPRRHRGAGVPATGGRARPLAAGAGRRPARRRRVLAHEEHGATLAGGHGRVFFLFARSEPFAPIRAPGKGCDPGATGTEVLAAAGATAAGIHQATVSRSYPLCFTLHIARRSPRLRRAMPPTNSARKPPPGWMDTVLPPRRGGTASRRVLRGSDPKTFLTLVTPLPLHSIPVAVGAPWTTARQSVGEWPFGNSQGLPQSFSVVHRIGAVLHIVTHRTVARHPLRATERLFA